MDKELSAEQAEIWNKAIEAAAQVCNTDPAFGFIRDSMAKHVNSLGTIDKEWQEVMMIPGRIRENIRALKV